MYVCDENAWDLLSANLKYNTVLLTIVIKKYIGQVFRPGALGRPRGIGWIGRWEGGLGWGTHVTPWLIHVNV